MRGWGTKSRLLPWARAGTRDSLQRRRVVLALPYAALCNRLMILEPSSFPFLDPFRELMYRPTYADRAASRPRAQRHRHSQRLLRDTAKGRICAFAGRLRPHSDFCDLAGVIRLTPWGRGRVTPYARQDDPEVYQFCCPDGVILRCLWRGQMARRNTTSKSHGKFGKHQSRSAEKVREDGQPITVCLNMRMIKNMAC